MTGAEGRKGGRKVIKQGHRTVLGQQHAQYQPTHATTYTLFITIKKGIFSVASA